MSISINYNAKLKSEKLQRLISAWTTLCPTKTFAGMTLAQFQTQVQPALDSNAQAEALSDQLVQAKMARSQTGNTSHKLVKLVVNAIKGDPTQGEDGSLYSALGYVPESARKSGLTRKKQTAPAAQPTVSTVAPPTVTK
jgi:hypothetical protein